MAYGIEAERLVRDFKDVRAVDGIDLAVAEGEIYGFLGPNGAGKSTTVHMLTTLLPPTDGRARVAGFDVVKEGPKVRSAIGAALQEAALDPLLTGREHLRLQTALHGIAKAERNRRSDELLERVGLEAAAERKVRTYSGGMKRRLDLALALVHRPRILFLDEPTTGLDPQSRTALWAEVGRLAQEDGVTVFLTTQYLEEADVLANRVGIIDHGRIVAEGTPAELKAEIAHPTVEAIPADPEQRPQLARILEQFGELAQVSPKSLAVRLAGRRVRPRRHRPRARHGGPPRRAPPAARAEPRRRLSREDRPHARRRRLRAAREQSPREPHGQVFSLARRSLTRTLRQPAYVIPPLLFPTMLVAVNAAGLRPSTQLDGFPTDSFLAFAVAVPFIQGALFATMNAGTDLARDIQNGFLNRLALTPMRGSALLAGHLAGVVVMGFVQSVFYLGCALAFGVEIESGLAGIVVILVLATLIAAGFGMLGAFMALRTGSGEAIQALFPVLFIFLFMSSMNAPRNLMEVDWFRAIATINPVSYLIEAVRSLIITGWNLKALSLGFVGRGRRSSSSRRSLASHALRVRMART